MCGICGLLAPDGAADAALVDSMNRALVHRGPDEGSVDVYGRCVLGHRRLQVIDLQTGSQPVTNEAGDVVAVFNGELYNFPELRGELAAKGHDVPGTGDTPVVPHLYEEHGPAFAERLSGMFAVAVWDARRERLVLARDRVGKKPLLWTHLPDGGVAFASELKALLRLPGLRRELDPQALDAYLALQYVPGPQTALRGVRRVAPGTVVVFEGGGVREERYWRLEPRADEPTPADVRAAVTAAVRRRLIADVPLGALLSGGIDSSVVVALMAEASSRPVKTFTVGFGDARYDERVWARAVADRFATEHEELVVELDAAATLPRLAAAYDEPLGDEAALPTFLICELARRHVTVALTGDGGDEAFGGYERYLAHEVLRRLPPARPLAAAARRLRRAEPRSRANRLGRVLEIASLPRPERYGRLMEVFPASLRAELWEPGFARPSPAAQLLGPPPWPGASGLQALDVESYLPGDLLLKADIASMAHSLELRSPFLDHEVLELGLATRPRKAALKAAFRDLLPAEILARGKTGFGVPLTRWFREDLRDFARDVLLDERARRRGQLRPAAVERLLREHDEGRADHGHRLWCLLMLELWQREHVENPLAAPVAA
jgi:asparagine synthase (glutamine-hydrolysing)